MPAYDRMHAAYARMQAACILSVAPALREKVNNDLKKFLQATAGMRDILNIKCDTII